MSTKSREIYLKQYPEGLPVVADFEFKDTDIPALQNKQILVKNLFMSVDPYMRGRMIDRESYMPPFQLNEALTGGVVGEIIESRDDQFPVGSQVISFLGWREYSVSTADELTLFDPKGLPLQHYLGALGMPGLTAYAGLLEIGQPKAGETVLVSAAAGAVGSMVAQIAKIKGCRVVGVAGTNEKCAWLRETLNVDETINYKTVESLTKAVAKACPKGVDVYYDNVGGNLLDAALINMNQYGRLVICGMIDQYNATDKVAGPSNLILVIPKSLKLQGFIYTDYEHLRPQFYKDMQLWIKDGLITMEETIIEGLDQAPSAFISLFSGANKGKMLVAL